MIEKMVHPGAFAADIFFQDSLSGLRDGYHLTYEYSITFEFVGGSKGAQADLILICNTA